MREGAPNPFRLVRFWVGVGCVLLGVALPFGFLFVPPHVLIPELIREPRIQVFPEGFAGLSLVAIGALLVVSAVHRARTGLRP